MIENSIVYRNLKKYNFFRISRAEGAYLWDKAGKKYIDFTSGWNVANLGWNHPEVNVAVAEQTKKNVHGLLWGSDPVQEAYAAKLTDALPAGLDACAKATGGTEAIEEAIKIARAFTERKKIIGFKESYHGQLFASMALGYAPASVERIAPLVPEFVQMDFSPETDSTEQYRAFLAELEETLARNDVAALVTEPGIITGWGSTRVAPNGFLVDVRKLTKKHGALLIVDEVGTGFSRTGALFGIEHERVEPDMIVFAKGISNGAAAIGTVVGRSEIFQATFPYVSIVSTFGWTPVACAAALKTLEIHERDETWVMAEAKGKRIMDALKPFVGSSVTHLRGKGMEIGVGVKDADTAKHIVDAAFEQGLHCVVGSDNNIQIMPPLTISDEVLDEGMEIFISSLSDIGVE